jgi:hypothetical protein
MSFFCREYHLSSQESDEGEAVALRDIQSPQEPYLNMSNGLNQATSDIPSFDEYPGVYDFSILMGAGNARDAKSSRKSWEVVKCLISNYNFRILFLD